MRYVSTRATAPPLEFEDAMLAGLARDGGLYVPEAWPRLEAEAIARLSSLPYAEAATRVVHPFLGEDVPEPAFAEIAQAAYAAFDHRAVAPLVQIGPDEWILELFHGPTLAFKDFAMQLLARLMDQALQRRGARATILAATSGDTGGAAIEAFRGREAIDIFVLHPKGRVSDVQRRQMTTASDANVHNLAIEGTFDDCQALVKAAFNDHALRDALSLAAVNSINWARIMAQTVYYVTAAAAVGAPLRAVSFCVPTGNFGDIFAAYVAKRMGLPVHRLVIATNVNDILARTLADGRYEPRAVVATSSPSMDIQVSSNFERLLFEASGRDGARVRAMMGSLAQSGAFDLTEGELAAIRAEFSAYTVDEDETAATIRDLLAETGYLADPHTAVGVSAARREERIPGVPMIVLATAHPAKFPEAIRAACGLQASLPARLAAQQNVAERYQTLPNDYKALAAFLRTHSRAVLEPQS